MDGLLSSYASRFSRRLSLVLAQRGATAASDCELDVGRSPTRRVLLAVLMRSFVTGRGILHSAFEY